jgi:hypothetical protein
MRFKARALVALVLTEKLVVERDDGGGGWSVRYTVGS